MEECRKPPNYRRAVLLCEISKVQFYVDKNFLCSGRFVLADMLESGMRKLRIFGVSSANQDHAFTFAIDEITFLSSHLASLNHLSSITATTRSGKVYTFIFTEGSMLDVIELLLYRRVIIRKEKTDGDYIVVASDPNLREHFLLNPPPLVFHKRSVFSEVELGERVSLEQVKTKLDSNGRISSSEFEKLRSSIGRHGVTADVIPTIWCYLLGIFEPGQSSLEQSAIIKGWEAEFNRCMAFLEDFTDAELQNFPILKASLHDIEIDIERTDGETEFYHNRQHRLSLVHIAKASLKSNLKVGYCQGMLDCASVFLQVAKGDKVLAYACYRKFLQHNGDIYGVDLSEMKTRLEKILAVLEICRPDLAKPLIATQGYFVAHAWIRLWLKRQFPLPVVTALWTAIFNRNFGSDTFHYIIAAIFIAKAGSVLEVENITDSTVTEIYRDISDLSLEVILTIAESCRKKYLLKTNKLSKPSFM